MIRMASAPASRGEGGQETGHSLGGAGNGDQLQLLGFVEAGAEASLLAALLKRHQPFGHFSDQHLDGVGADIDDSATRRLHGSARI